MAKYEIISVFHSVETNIGGIGNVEGVLTTGRQNGTLFFHWKKYTKVDLREVKNRNPEVEEQVPYLYLQANNIQKVMVNYQEMDSYILISTISPASMVQLTFPKHASDQVFQFVQTLALDSVKTSSADVDPVPDWLEFIYYGFTSPEKYRLYDITVSDGKLVFPSDFIPAKSKSVVIVQPDMHIVSQFGIKKEEIMEHPVGLDDVRACKSIGELKAQVMQRGLQSEIRCTVWPVLLGVLPFEEEMRDEILKTRREEYFELKRQWQTISRTELKYNKMLKEAFSTIRVDVRRTHLLDGMQLEGDWRATLISILKSFAVWNFDVRYTQGLNDICLNFMCVIFSGVSQGMSYDDCEALSFWCFASFLEVIASGLIASNMMAMQNSEMKEIMDIVDRFHPGCAKWIRTNNLHELSFLISSFILSYGRSFRYDSIPRIWETILATPAPWLFLRYFSASLLIMSFPSFSIIPDCSTGKMVSMMDIISREQDVGNLLGVALSMMERSPHEVEKSMMNEPKRPVELDIDQHAYQLISIDTSSSTKYQALGLFL